MGQERSLVRALRDRIITMRDAFVAVWDNHGTARLLWDKSVPWFVHCGTESLQCGTLLLQYGTITGLRAFYGTRAFLDSRFAGQNHYNAGRFCCETGQSRDSAPSMGQERSLVHALRDRIITMRDAFVAVRDNHGTARLLWDKSVP